jgi:UDP-N-acetylmuramoylalanine--D-glutamate ligase
VTARPPIPQGPYLVVGLARSGVAAALALAARGEQVIGVDSGTPAGLEQLRGRGVELHVGRDPAPELLDRARALVKSPGVPAEAPLVSAARERGVVVLGELELGWRLLRNEFIAVTGTNGKTTTVELVAHILRAGGIPVAAAGNVGTAVCSLVGEIAREVVVACEVSSFQLEDASRFAPEVAVLLNVSADHLDRHGTMERYEAAKLRIFAEQSDAGVAVVPAEMADRIVRTPRVVSFGSTPSAAVSLHDGSIWWRGESLLRADELRLRGAHNVHNAMAAVAACLAYGVAIDAVRAGLRSFAGVAHRLEDVATQAGVLYVNDSKATNVASTLVALEAFAGQRVHLIVGGRGKEQDFSPLREAVAHACAAVYLIGEDAPTIARALAGAGPELREFGDLEHALRASAEAARAGEVVLLSPACASFDQFANFEARGELFRELIAQEGLRENASK